MFWTYRTLAELFINVHPSPLPYSSLCRFSAAVYAEPPSMQKVILYSSYKLADKTECWGKARGGLLHEMMHMFGVMHTQMRADRDKYITIYKNNVQSFYRREYDVICISDISRHYNISLFQICKECNDHGVPYDCSSIMHYGAETFSTGNWTMRPKSKVGQYCFKFY